MKKIHIAISTHSIEQSIADNSERLGCEPCVVVSDQYALWRADNLNLSIRQSVNVPADELRHLGFEDPDAREFLTSTDVNGILWEQFSAKQQAQEVAETWPDAAMMPI